MRALLRCLQHSVHTQLSSQRPTFKSIFTSAAHLSTTTAAAAAQQNLQQIVSSVIPCGVHGRRQQQQHSMAWRQQQQHSMAWQQQQQQHHSMAWQQQQQQCRWHSSWQGMEDNQRHSTTILCIRRGSEVVIIGDGQATQKDFIVKSNVRKVRRIGSAAVGGFAGVAVDGLALLERLETKLEEHPGQLQRAAVELAKMWRQDKLLRELDASLIVADAKTTLWLMGNGDVLEAGTDGVIGIGSGADFAESAARALMQLHRDKYGEKVQPAGIEPGSSAQKDESYPAAQSTEGPEANPSSSSSSNSSNSSNSSSGITSSSSSKSDSSSDSVVYGPDMSLMDVAQAAMKIASDSCVYTNSNFNWFHIKTDGGIVAGGAAAAAAAAAGNVTTAKATAAATA